MKLQCRCGALISDGGDALPHKGHFIPDVEWFATLERFDAVVEDLAARRVTPEVAAMTLRSGLSSSARATWQCRECGRLYVDRSSGTECFRPER